MENLTLITWTDDNNRAHRLEIVSRICSEYHNTAIQLGQSINDVDNYMSKSNRDIQECCIRIFTRWMDNDGHLPTYPNSWVGICRLLYAIRMCNVEDELIKALASYGINISRQCRRNFDV
jgi:hypothetical protein